MKGIQTLIFFFLLAGSNLGFSQNNDLLLAQQYYAEGDFQKAVVYYEKVYKKDDSHAIFSRYFDCLNQIGDFKKAEKVITKQIKADPDRIIYHFQYAGFLENQNRKKEAEKIYQDLIDTKSSSTLVIKDLFNLFKDINRLDLAKQTLDRGRKNFKKSFPLYLEFAQVYYLEQNYSSAIDEIIDFSNFYPSKLDDVKVIFAKWMAENDEDEKFQETLKNKIIKNVQRTDASPHTTDLLIWYFLQRKQFDVALTQVKALDRREKGAGKRVFNFGLICLQNKEYEIATEAFQYVTTLPDTYLLNDAKRAILQVRYVQITQEKQYDDKTIQTTIQAYKEAIGNGRDERVNFDNILELSKIEAYYANNSSSAISRLKKLQEAGGLTSMQQATAKMLLADIYVLKDNIWEASLLYMQIDRDFKYEPIGFEAKFKNARIFYYSGDFKFAQSQLDVLKKSTSKLIANDAMNLSILITDNFGLDSNFQAMQLFAKADLLLEQHLYDRAFTIYDSIAKEHPQSGLMDEIALRKAKAMMDLGKWDRAISFLNEITLYHAYDILMDDALFYLGDIYQFHKNDPEKAMENYLKLLMDHPASLYTIEVRERIKTIRGK